MFSSPSRALRERKQPENTKERRPGRPSTAHQVRSRLSLTLLEPDGFADDAAVHRAQGILYGVQGDDAVTILDHAVLILHIQPGDRSLKDTKPSAMNAEASSSPAGCIVQGKVPQSWIVWHSALVKVSNTGNILLIMNTSWMPPLQMNLKRLTVVSKRHQTEHTDTALWYESVLTGNTTTNCEHLSSTASADEPQASHNDN